MAVSHIFTFAIIFAALVALSRAVPVTTEADVSSSAATEEIEETTLAVTTTAAPLRNCTNARGLAGACAARQDCDYSSGPVDHSLYVPKGYESSCFDGELCCPYFALTPELLLPQNQTVVNEDDHAFSDERF